MNSFIRITLLLLITHCPLICCASTFSVAQIPKGPKWVLHLDVETLKKSSLGKQILSELASDESQRHLAAFEARAGFDPRIDLDGVTAYGTGDSEDTSLAMLEGKISLDRLKTRAMRQPDFRAVRHAGADLYRWTETTSTRAQKVYGAALGTSTVVAGQSLRLMLATLDLHAGKGSSMKGQALLSGLENERGALLVAAANLQSLQGVNPQSEMFQLVRTAKLILREDSNRVLGTLSLDTDRPESALQVQTFVQGFIAIAMFSQRDNPEQAELARTLSIRTSGAQVFVSMNAAPEQVMLLLRKEIREQIRKMGAVGGGGN